MGTAIAVEGRKAVAARPMAAVTLAIVVGVTGLAVAMTLAARSANPNLTAKLGLLADQSGWSLYLSAVAQITAAGSVLAFGIALSWLVGREFADGTITGLFGLPVVRPTIAAAKLTVYLGWAIAVGIALVVALIVAGVALQLGPLDSTVREGLLRQLLLTNLSALIVFPVGWVASLTRGILGGIAATVAIIVVAQGMAVSGVGAWFPVVAPALWAINPGSVSLQQLGLVVSIPLVFGTATLRVWRRLQLDR